MSRFENDVAVVTGAGSGIGREIAMAFAAEGANLVVADVDDEGGHSVVEEIRAAGGEATFAHVDVTNTDDVEAMVQTAVDTYGALDVAVNNAGIGGEQAPTGEYPEAAWNQVIDVNLSGVFRCLKAELAQLSAQGDGGAIVNMASVLGLVGFADAPAYTAAKHGVIGLTQVAALEYATAGIRVNAVCPGFIETPMLEAGGITSDPEMLAQVEALHAMNRLGQPAEIADAVLWACSDGASFLTGEELTVDGGYTSR